MPAPPTIERGDLRFGVRTTDLGAGFSFTAGPIDAFGFSRIKGTIRSGAAALAGSPTVGMGPDGTNFDLSFVIPQDLSQAAFTYDFDLEILSRFVNFDFTDAGAGSSPFRAFVWLVP